MADIVIRWGVGAARNCSHKTVTFVQDDHVKTSRIETEEYPGIGTALRTPVSRVQVIRPYTQVQCQDCGQRGEVSIEGETEVYMENGRINMRRT